MKAFNKKAKRIIISVVCFILTAVIIFAAVMFFPLNGKEHIEIWSAKDTFNINSIQTVEKKADTPFKILLITDVQLWTNPSENKQAYEDIKKLVKLSAPDLILTLGDNVSGITSRYILKNFISLMDSFKIPWAPVFGNHDNEIPMTTLNWQGDKFEQSKYCLFKKGPSNLYGCGNYVLNITENSKPVQTLFMFDNGRYIDYGNKEKKEVYMGYDQIAWYEWNVNGIAENSGSVVPSMTFSHFALPEFCDAVERCGKYNESDGSYTIPAEYGSGKCAYLPGASPVNSGFFDKCRELGSTKYIFCGHDHENDASITLDGITMSYGLKTGPSPSPWNFAEKTGATVITIGNEAENHAVSFENIILHQEVNE